MGSEAGQRWMAEFASRRIPVLYSNSFTMGAARVELGSKWPLLMMAAGGRRGPDPLPGREVGRSWLRGTPPSKAA